MLIRRRLTRLFTARTQRDDYIALLLAHIGDRYYNSGSGRCHGTPGWDCSGYLSGDLLREAGGPYLCGNTDSLARYLIDHHLTCDRATARATPGAWAIRLKENPIVPGDGHMVASMGDGSTAEAHSHADGVYRGTFDGNRGFTHFGFPPLAGFGPSPKPPKPIPVVVPPPRTVTIPGDPTVEQTDLSMKLDGSGNGYVDFNSHKAVTVHGLTVIGTIDPSIAHAYSPIPRVGLTIGPAGWARVVVEGGIPNGPASVRIVHD